MKSALKLAGVTTAAILVAALAACGEDDPTPAPSKTVATPTAVTTSVLVPSAVATPTTTTVPTLTSEAERKTGFYKAVVEIDDEIAANEDDAWAMGLKTCEAVAANPTDQDGLVEQVEKDFASSKNTDGLQAGEALSILEKVREYVCPGA